MKAFLKTAFAAALLMAGTPVAAQENLRFINLMPAIDAFVARTQGMDGAERLAAFNRDIRPLAGGYYAKVAAPKLLNHLAIYPLRRQKIMAVSDRFDGMFADARNGFERTFGPIQADQPILLVHSFGEMDGGTRQLPAGMTLLFGADVIARVHDQEDTRPFFHHELFHLMHLPRFWADEACEGNWCMVWGEGLATYVAVQLNPTVADKAMMIDSELRKAVDVNKGAAICAARAAIFGSDDRMRAQLLTSNNHLEGYPPRLGYYIGYLVAADLGKTRSLKELAALSPAQVQPLIEQSLAGMADCGQAGRKSR